MFSKRSPFSGIEEVNTQIKQQQQLIEDIQDDIKCTVEIADTLTQIVNKPLSHALREQSPLEKYNSAQLKVCTDNLDTFSVDIEKMWLNQSTYHEQARELCSFEEDFGKV